MAMLGYRSTFTIDLDRTTTTDRAHAVDDVLKEGFEWLRTQKHLDGVDTLEPGVTRVFPEGHEVTFVRGTTDAGTEYAKLIALDPPPRTAAAPVRTRQARPRSPRPPAPALLQRRRGGPGSSTGTTGDRWATSLLVGVDPRDPHTPPMVAIEVEAPQDPTRYGIGGAMFTARPRLATNILGAFACDDHGFQVSDGPRLLLPEDIDDLLDQLAETDHHGLVFLSGTDDTLPAHAWRTSLEKVTRETVGQAAVFVLSPEATGDFNARVSPTLAVPAYGLRIFRPGVDLDDPADARRHRAVSASTLVVDSRVEDLRRSFGRLCREHANSVPLDRFLRRLDIVTAMRMDELAGVSARPAASTGAGPGVAAPPAVAVTVTATIPSATTRTPTGAPDTSPGTAPDAAPGNATGDEGGAGPARWELELADLGRRNAALRAELDQALALQRDLRDRLSEVATAAENHQRATERNALRRAEEHQCELDALRAELDGHDMENALLSEELHDLQDELRTSNYRLERARRRLAEEGMDVSVSFEEPQSSPYVDAPDSWEDLQYLSSEQFPNLLFGDDCWQAASELAPRDPFGQWVRLTWDALVTLDEFARHRAASDCPFEGGLREYLGGHAPAGAHLIPKGRLRASESDTVKGRKDWSRERCFRVPEQVDPSGTEQMLAHIVIQTNGSISPRLYFDDRTADLGVVVVGYIGPHLTNTKTR